MVTPVFESDANNCRDANLHAVVGIDVELELECVGELQPTKSVCNLVIEEDQPLKPNTSLARLITAVSELLTFLTLPPLDVAGVS